MPSLSRRRRRINPPPRRDGALLFLLLRLVPVRAFFGLHHVAMMMPPSWRGQLRPIRPLGSSRTSALMMMMMQQQQKKKQPSASAEVLAGGAGAGGGGVVSVDPETNQIKFMHLTKDQDDELKRLGEREERLMKIIVPLAPTVTAASSKKSKRPRTKGRPGFGGGGGFAGSAPPRDQRIHARAGGTEVQALADVLARDGLVCLEHVLPDAAADRLLEYLIDLRDRSRAAVESGLVANSHDRFADVLLNRNRCDLKVPLGPVPVNDALRCLLLPSSNSNSSSEQSTTPVLRDLLEAAFERHGSVGSQSTLYELNCFMSQSGARRQLVHADIVCQSDDERPTILSPDEPIMLTCFVALQDVDETMGPTYFIPGTHNREAHEQFFEINNSKGTKDKLLGSRPAVMGTLKKGSCILFDPRTLHCAGANACNDPEKTRALFYFSFKNPKVDSPGCPSCGGYGIPDAEFTLQRLCEELEAEVSSGDLGAAAYRKLAMIASNP